MLFSIMNNMFLWWKVSVWTDNVISFFFSFLLWETTKSYFSKLAENKSADLFPALEACFPGIRPLQPYFLENSKNLKSTLLIKCVKLVWLKVFHYKISYTRNDLVIKMRISSRISNLNFASVAKSAFESHFPNSIIPGKQKIHSVKNFCLQQIWQIYITKYYCFHGCVLKELTLN